MRLAGQPFPHGASGRLESNQRSPVPETGGMSVFPTASRSTPGGTRTRASGLRTRRHCRSTTGAWIGGPGVEPGLARYQRAVPPRTPTSEAPAAGVEPACRDEQSRALPFGHTGMKGRSGRRGSRTPNGRSRTRFRDGIPRPWQSFRDGPGRSRTCTVPIKSRQLSRIELRSRGGVAGRLRTCDAPRFRRPLYRTELRPRGKWARLGSNQQPLVCKTSALPDCATRP
jgi:hypothetical protein